MLEKQLNKYTELLLDALLRGESDIVGKLMDECLDSGITLQSLYTDIIAAAQCHIGDLWVNGKATIAQEHRSTQIILDQLSRIRQNFRARKPLGLHVIISALPGDNHSLGGRMVCDLLILDGWSVDYLGADTPIAEIVRHAKEVSANLVGLSLSDAIYLPSAKEAIQKLRTEIPDIKIMIGGRGVMKNIEADKIGADVVVTSGTEAVAEARKVVGAGGSTNGLYQTLGEIGGRIHHFRKTQKMSQEKLAAGSGLDRAYISSVENGKQNVTIGALLKLSDALGVELADLINAPLQSNN